MSDEINVKETISPLGDGNVLFLLPLIIVIRVKETISPLGDGNFSSFSVFFGFSALLKKQYPH